MQVLHGLRAQAGLKELQHGQIVLAASDGALSLAGVQVGPVHHGAAVLHGLTDGDYLLQAAELGWLARGLWPQGREGAAYDGGLVQHALQGPYAALKGLARWLALVEARVEDDHVGAHVARVFQADDEAPHALVQLDAISAKVHEVGGVQGEEHVVSSGCLPQRFRVLHLHAGLETPADGLKFKGI